jgi:hypothetical protein
MSNRQNRVQQPAFNGPQSEFINYELDVDQKKAYLKFRDDPEGVFDVLTEVCQRGDKVSIKWDDFNKCCAAFAFPGEGSVNVGYILSGRGSTGYRALAELLFKDNAVLFGEWGNAFKRKTVDIDPDF